MRYLITFKDVASKRILEEYNASNIELFSNLKNITVCELSEESADELSRDDLILSVEIDCRDSFDAGGDSESGVRSYAHDLLEVKKYHDLGYKGQGIKIAIFDSGIQKHENLNIAGGFNAYDQNAPFDSNINNSHGTMVAGVLAGKGINGAPLGVAPECELYAVKLDDNVSTKNGSFWSEQIAGMDWAINNNIDIINCSFSGLTDSIARRSAFKAAHEAGIIICCSAGNMQNRVTDDRSTIGFPANYPFVVTTANVRSDKTRYVTSCLGKNINFSSGGVSITSTTTDRDNQVSIKYRSGTGTSYASPTIAGVIALIKNMFPT